MESTKKQTRKVTQREPNRLFDIYAEYYEAGAKLAKEIYGGGDESKS